MSIAVRRRLRARIRGTVQGVGFRPFVYRLAIELGLAGFVLNDSAGVVVEAEGDSDALERFFDRLGAEAPPLARVERVDLEAVPAVGSTGFVIRASPAAGEPAADVSADSAPCRDCLRELFDPADRRFRYPFINCTNCGPRFTIVRGVPYDRPTTTMAGFAMCDACRREYHDPADRRFHAQPNACPDCGPTLRLVSVSGHGEPADPLAAALDALLAGRIVAVKGLGGFHLACRADDEGAVATLRARKHREEKPFALMAPSLEAVGELVELADEDAELLTSPERPIVLAPRRARARVAAAVAPRSRRLGVMLPYSPLHHLLLADAGVPLVMTSGNVADEPIAYRDDDALTRLAGIADLFLLHDRPIETRTDDSVVQTALVGGGRRRLFQRRSRGYVPRALRLPVALDAPVLACGAQLKNTFCVAKGERAWVSHHVGDLENWETLSSFADGIEHFERLFAVEPRVVAHDLHPDYLSTRYAFERAGADLVGVQHHHAHLAACLAEHGERGPAIGAIFDGTGYGGDGTVWGGELLLGGLDGFERVGHLWPVPMPGGAAAIREPWRMACAWLGAARARGVPEPPWALAGIAPDTWNAVARIAQAPGPVAPLTSSVGRLFDAVSALCGVRTTVAYEGQAAIELEAACDPAEERRYPLALAEREGALVLDARCTVEQVAADLDAGVAAATVAARFHNALADATVRACTLVAAERGCRTVVLSGGSFQNRRLLERTAAGLEREQLRVLIPEELPPGDGGVAYGQAAVAAARLAR